MQKPKKKIRRLSTYLSDLFLSISAACNSFGSNRKCENFAIADRLRLRRKFIPPSKCGSDHYLFEPHHCETVPPLRVLVRTIYEKLARIGIDAFAAGTGKSAMLTTQEAVSCARLEKGF